MGSLDGVDAARCSRGPANTIIQNHGGGAAIDSLTTDGDEDLRRRLGVLRRRRDANFEGVFAADPATGVLDWIDGGRGDNYDIAVAGDVLYTVGHPHDWGMLDWNPQTDPSTFQRAMAIDKHRSPTLTNAFGTSGIWQSFDGRPGGATAALVADADRRYVHRAEPGGVERRHQRRLHRARAASSRA